MEPFFAAWLSSDQLRTVGSITVAWAWTDWTLGQILVNLHRLAPGGEPNGRIHQLTLANKVGIFKDAMKSGIAPGKMSTLIEELVFISDNFRFNRNHIVHGVPLGDAFWSQSKMEDLPIVDLDRNLEEALYASHVAGRMLLLSIGGEGDHIPALPPRPTD